MQYFAGLFDAEGYVSLGKEGRFHIGTEMTNEEVPKLFKDTFGGNIYIRTRENRKKTYTWVISTNIQVSINFIDQIAPYSIIKKTQLLRLRDYLDQTREFKRQIRDEVSHQLSCLKKPLPLTKEQISVETNQIINDDFLMWFAGFIDGDGNICVFEYQGKKSIIFDSWIGIFNTFPESIIYVKKHINGSISKYKGNKFPIWKWVCCQKDSISICEQILPFLKIKKEQCKLVLEFLNIQKTKIREQSYSFEQINRIREIITQIKHLNSL